MFEFTKTVFGRCLALISGGLLLLLVACGEPAEQSAVPTSDESTTADATTETETTTEQTSQ